MNSWQTNSATASMSCVAISTRWAGTIARPESVMQDLVPSPHTLSQ
jgi:hypothetical protein